MCGSMCAPVVLSQYISYSSHPFLINPHHTPHTQSLIVHLEAQLDTAQKQQQHTDTLTQQQQWQSFIGALQHANEAIPTVVLEHGGGLPEDGVGLDGTLRILGEALGVGCGELKRPQENGGGVDGADAVQVCVLLLFLSL